MVCFSFIPARGGSKRIANKNLVPLGSFNLVQHACIQSYLSSSVHKTIVSTDSDIIQQSVESLGLSSVYVHRRSKSSSSDTSTDLVVLSEVAGQYSPDIWVHLRPTYPLRSASSIDKFVSLFSTSREYSSLKSVCKTSAYPQKLWLQPLGRRLSDIYHPMDSQELSGMPTQILDNPYTQTNSIDIYTHSQIKSGRLWGDNIMFQAHGASEFDVDDYGDLNLCRIIWNSCFHNHGMIELSCGLLELDEVNCLRRQIQDSGISNISLSNFKSNLQMIGSGSIDYLTNVSNEVLEVNTYQQELYTNGFVSSLSK